MKTKVKIFNWGNYIKAHRRNHFERYGIELNNSAVLEGLDFPGVKEGGKFLNKKRKQE